MKPHGLARVHGEAEMDGGDGVERRGTGAALHALVMSTSKAEHQPPPGTAASWDLKWSM
jgi:hypothetical protein